MASISHSSAYLKPPSSSSSQRQRVASGSSSSAAPTPPPRAPVSVHATTTVSETATFHGTHPITIGSGTVIHPRARLYSFLGPIQIGDGCVIGEKTIIGDNEPSSAKKPREGEGSSEGKGDGTMTRISSSVTIGPQATIHTGAYIRSAAIVDALAVIHRNATVGSHSKVCSKCEVSEGSAVEDWTVVWSVGGGGRIGQRKRRRYAGPAAHEQGPGHRPDVKRIEDARLMVLHREREGLAKMISLSASGGSKRR